MNLGRLIRKAIKLAPIIYPIIRKIKSQKKNVNKTTLKK